MRIASTQFLRSLPLTLALLLGGCTAPDMAVDPPPPPPPPVTRDPLGPPPTQWNGINYFPRGHQFYLMLNDWFTQDSTTGLVVSALARADMQRLHDDGGVNFLHLYLWDRTWFGTGFNEVGFDPRTSANRQWEALDDFLTAAAEHGLYVGVHFVSQPIIKALQSNLDLDQAKALATSYTHWTDVFMRELSARHRNILMWGVAYALGPIGDVGGAANAWNVFYQSTYAHLQQTARATAPMPGTGLVAINLGLTVTPDPNGYDYGWNPYQAQKAAQVMNELGLVPPDVYMMQLYNANSQDLARDLALMTGPPLGLGAMTIPADRILAVEFATSSSLAPPPLGNGVVAAGDAQTPTTTLAGHAAWLTNTLCAFKQTGVQKLAYWALYDADDFWSQPPFNLTGQALAWNGFWGVLPRALAAAPKPAWSVLTGLYRDGTLPCPAVAPPVLALLADVTSATAGQAITLTWSAADVADLQIDQGIGQVRKSVGSITVPAPASGPVRYTLTGKNRHGVAMTTATASVVVDIAP